MRATMAKVAVATTSVLGGGAGASAAYRVRPAEVSSGARFGHGVPASIPAGQAYYWSRRWQQDERESLSELEAGEGMVFESAEQFFAWLDKAQ